MKINRNFAKIALFFLFFPTGFNGWNVFLFATDQAATPAAQSKSSPDSPILKIQTEYPNVSPQKNTPISNLPPAKLPSSIPDLSQGKADGLPLYFPGEQKTLLELASWLQNTQDSELKVLSFGPVGFIALNAKSKTFRGKAVQISGRLLKTRYLPILDTNNALNSLDHHKPQNQITNRVIQGFYETWVLLDDNTEIPVRLWTLSIPNENILQDITKGKTNQLYRRERIQATGIYYRLTSFYDGTDFRNTPMLVAKNFSILENAQNNATREVSDPPGTTKSLNHLNVKIICVALVVLLWLVYRFFRRKRHRTTLADHDAAANLTSLGLILFCFIAFSLGTVRVWGASEKTPSPESNPQSLPTDDRLSELPNDMPTMLQVLARVQCQSVFWDGLPPERRSAFLRKQSVFPDVKSPNDLRYPFWGKITQIKQVPIPGAPRDSEEKPYYYRCLISTKDAKDHTQSIIVYAASLPSFQINRVGRLADIGQKQGNVADESNLTSGIGETVGGIGFLMLDESRREKNPVLCAAQFGWFPENHLLGKLGMDVASFDAVPVFSPQKIAQWANRNNTELSPRLRRTVMSSLRLTKADTNAFYGLLAAGNRAEDSQLFHSAKEYWATTENKPAYCPAVELFNRPERYQGELVLLRGHARRVERIPVGDEEIRKRFGIDSYYQIIFFTPDSQGNPLVVCVPQLPQGMPVGSGKGYRQEIEVAAFFLKSWAYRGWPLKENQGIQPNTSSAQKSLNDEPLDAAGKLIATDNININAEQSPALPADKTNPANGVRRPANIPWVKAPLLVGGSVHWIPQPADSSGPTPAAVRWTFTVFAALVFFYFSYRLFRRPFTK